MGVFVCMNGYIVRTNIYIFKRKGKPKWPANYFFSSIRLMKPSSISMSFSLSCFIPLMAF